MGTNSPDVILDKLPPDIRAVLEKCRPAYEDKITELTFRADRPVCIYLGCKMKFITNSGLLTDSVNSVDLLTTSASDISDIVLRLCDYSIYAYQNEINSGFITIGNGVRVGLCGSAVTDGGRIVNIRDISSLNFRIARDIKGCSARLLSMIDPLSGVLICGEPSSGKTTLIRDMARRLSYRYRVSLIDERRELSASTRGRYGYDVGLCDVYAGYPKGIAAVSAVRSMAPDLIVCDEIGDRSDAETLSFCLRRGAAFIASAHASSMDGLRSMPYMSDIISSCAFGSIVFMAGRSQPGRIDRIYEMSGKND